MNLNDPTTGLKTSFKRRVGIVTGILWIIIVLIITLNTNTYTYGNPRDPMLGVKFIRFFTDFIEFGIIPITLAFGITWILEARKRKN